MRSIYIAIIGVAVAAIVTGFLLLDTFSGAPESENEKLPVMVQNSGSSVADRQDKAEDNGDGEDPS